MGPVLLQEETGVPRRWKPSMLGRVKLDNILLTCDQGNFNRITARSWKRTLVSGERHMHYLCATSTPIVSNITSKRSWPMPFNNVWTFSVALIRYGHVSFNFDFVLISLLRLSSNHLGTRFIWNLKIIVVWSLCHCQKYGMCFHSL